MQQLGKYIIIAGGLLVLIGLIMLAAGNKLHFLGRLPGDIRIEKEHFKFYFPVTSLVIVSLIVNLVIWVIRKFF